MDGYFSGEEHGTYHYIDPVETHHRGHYYAYGDDREHHPQHVDQHHDLHGIEHRPDDWHHGAHVPGHIFAHGTLHEELHGGHGGHHGFFKHHGEWRHHGYPGDAYKHDVEFHDGTALEADIEHEYDDLFHEIEDETKHGVEHYDVKYKTKKEIVDHFDKAGHHAPEVVHTQTERTVEKHDSHHHELEEGHKALYDMYAHHVHPEDVHHKDMRSLLDIGHVGDDHLEVFEDVRGEEHQDHIPVHDEHYPVHDDHYPAHGVPAHHVRRHHGPHHVVYHGEEDDFDIVRDRPIHHDWAHDRFDEHRPHDYHGMPRAHKWAAEHGWYSGHSYAVPHHEVEAAAHHHAYPPHHSTHAASYSADMEDVDLVDQRVRDRRMRHRIESEDERFDREQMQRKARDTYHEDRYDVEDERGDEGHRQRRRDSSRDERRGDSKTDARPTLHAQFQHPQIDLKDSEDAKASAERSSQKGRDRSEGHDADSHKSSGSARKSDEKDAKKVLSAEDEAAENYVKRFFGTPTPSVPMSVSQEEAQSYWERFQREHDVYPFANKATSSANAIDRFPSKKETQAYWRRFTRETDPHYQRHHARKDNEGKPGVHYAEESEVQ